MIRVAERLQPHTLLLRSAGSRVDWPVLVVDDFFEDPGLVRALALSLDYSEERASYPGVAASTSVPRWPLHGVIAKLLTELFQHVFGAAAVVSPARPSPTRAAPAARRLRSGRPRPDAIPCVGHDEATRENSVVFTAFCPSYSAQYLRDIPHVDGVVHELSRVPYSCLVYLNPDAAPHGGTAVLEHVESGAIAVPVLGGDETDSLCERVGATDAADLIRRLTWMTGHYGAWRLREHVENRFNRLVCFPGNLLHSIYSEPIASPTLETVRLTLNEFVVVKSSGSML